MTDDGNKNKASRFIKGTSIEKPPNQDGEGLMAMLWHPLCILLICFPFGVLADLLDWGASAVFWLNFLGLVPLAKILGDATEELAAGLHNDMLAGLLNATFGNAVEVVMMVTTLRAGLVDVVKATLLGSVLSNLLLVLGCSFFFGGIVTSGLANSSVSRRLSLTEDDSVQHTSSDIELVAEKVQTFSVMSALLNMSLLLLSCLSLCLNTVFFTEYAEMGENMDSIVLIISRSCACCMMIAYVAYVFDQLFTNREALNEEENEGAEAKLTVTASICAMLCVTLFIAYGSELLVKSLREVVSEMHISRHFIGIILLPIVGNACEHAAAIRFAIQDKPGLSIGIAVGSSTQISLFVVPLSVLMGWAMDQPMDLNFGSLNATVVMISVVVVLSIVVDGSATWLQGYLLISAYYVVGVLYWHLPDKMSEIS